MSCWTDSPKWRLQTRCGCPPRLWCSCTLGPAPRLHPSCRPRHLRPTPQTPSRSLTTDRHQTRKKSEYAARFISIQTTRTNQRCCAQQALKLSWKFILWSHKRLNFQHQPERNIVFIKHLCHTQQLSSILLGRVQHDHLHEGTRWCFPHNDSNLNGFIWSPLLSSGLTRLWKFLRICLMTPGKVGLSSSCTL